MLLGLGSGLSYAALNAGFLKVVIAEELGVASGIFLMITLLGNVAGVTLVTFLYNPETPLKGLTTIMNGVGLISFITAIVYLGLMKVDGLER